VVEKAAERFGEEKNILPYLGCKALYIHKKFFIDIYSCTHGSVVD
jgi:hypothetical protein